MQPYRIIGFKEHTPTVFAAMLSKDNRTNARMIYIIEKHLKDVISNQLSLFPIPDENHYKQVAHTQTTRRNSDILAKYQIAMYGMTRYVVYDPKIDNYLEGEEYTQQDCLKLALKDFCKKNSVYVVKEV